MALTQSKRPVGVSSPLGDDVLLFRRMTATEQLGRMFRLDLELLSEDEQLKLEDILGQNLTVRLNLADDEKRYFNGLASRFAQVGTLGKHWRYEVTLRPWLWFLTRTADCRIFQEKSIPDIIKEVFREHGFTDFEESLSGSYSPWTYCVQYRETDFNFVSRLMEQAGIYYYFKHEDGKHTLVLSDSYSSHAAIPGYEEIPFLSPGEDDPTEKDHVFEWQVAQEVQPGNFALTDYDFEKPKADLGVKSTISRSHEHADFEIFDFPGEYLETGDGDNYARARIEELQAQHERVHGTANARGLTSGGLFKLIDCPREDQNREYLVVSATHELRVNQYETGAAEGEGPTTYHCRLSAIDAKQPFRTPRKTPKPTVQGPQTAVVVGKSGEEIWTDKYGRVKVQFPWDRYGKADENSSCWVRVAQVWAGKTWGGIQIPRMGQEVIVEFLEGDPDRPIITGRVYNADNMPPYELPANQTQSGMKSRSSKEGSPDNFNEFRFEDMKGEEQVYLHAEKNYDQVTENDRTEDVGHDRSLQVGNDKKEKVGNSKSIEVGNDHSEAIGSSMTINVGSNLTETVAINYAETVGAAMELSVGAALTVSVGAAMAETIGAHKSETIGDSKNIEIGKSLEEKIGENQTLEIGKDLTESIEGMHRETVTKEFSLEAKKIQITAKDEIAIKTGKAELVMKKNGDITIKGKKISVKGSGDVVIKGSKIAGN